MARTGAIKSKIILLVLVPLIVWISAFELIPIARMIIMSFQNDAGQGFTLGQYVKSLSKPLYVQALRNSIKVSFISSVVAMIIAMGCAYAITQFSTRVRDGMLMITNMFTNFVGVPLAFAYMILLGANGAFILLAKELGLDRIAGFDLYSENGMLLVYIYYQIPLSILLIYPIYYALRAEWREAAALLGASTTRYWRHIGIPVMLPGLLSTFSILMANALGTYATAYALTGINYNLMTIRIASLVSGDIFPNFQLGSALAVILAVIMVIALFISESLSRWSRRRGY